VLFDSSYWQKVIDFDALVEMDMVAADHRDLFEYADTAEEAWLSMRRRGLVVPPIVAGRRLRGNPGLHARSP
jgi:predicted Rossmann-fold nucleotide-binding protein